MCLYSVQHVGNISVFLIHMI